MKNSIKHKNTLAYMRISTYNHVYTGAKAHNATRKGRNMNSKVKVSERAVFLRVQRKLKANGEMIKKCRPTSKWYNDLGEYYIIDERNFIARKNVDLEECAKQYGCIAKHEEIAE
jgi:hypothetical protein